MNSALILEQVLNGVQLGVMLFLMAAGLTLIFGIMNFITLVHGSLYMLGAFFAATILAWTHSFLAAAVIAVAGCFAVGVALDALALRHLYVRSHLDQVLGTFGLLLFFNDLTLTLWGPEPYFMAMPRFLSGAVPLIAGSRYPVYRLAITAAGLAVAALLYILIARMRLGMLIRAAASNREMLGGLGGNVRAVMIFVFGLGSALAGFAGVMAAPLVAVQVGMGDAMLITAFVVVVIGGIGSVRGAFVSAILVGLVDTMGRALLPAWLGFTAGPAVASMAIYLLMAAVLLIRPTGIFSPRRA
jgi:branched-chain amino acid transport system permease protein